MNELPRAYSAKLLYSTSLMLILKRLVCPAPYYLVLHFVRRRVVGTLATGTEFLKFLFTQKGMGTRLSSELGRVVAVKNRVTPHLSYTVANTRWVSYSHLATRPLAKGCWPYPVFHSYRLALL